MDRRRSHFKVSKAFVVIYEAQADLDTATELADRVLVARVDWLDETLLDSQRQWIGTDPSGSLLSWKSMPSRARELGIRVRGHFDGAPGCADARAARRAVAYVLRSLENVEAILLIRDMDDQIERRHGLGQASALYSALVKIVLGVAIPERECWVISGFDPENDSERQRLESETRKLGANPCESSHQLTAGKNDQALRSPKRVLAALVGNDRERQRKCWMTTSLDVLGARGRENGLKDYLKEIDDHLVPLITGHQLKKNQ
jgi:hypothetical protein